VAEVVNIHEALRLDHARVHKATDQLVKASRERFDGFQDIDTGVSCDRGCPPGVRRRHLTTNSLQLRSGT
jgi:hypothetical protein